MAKKKKPQLGSQVGRGFLLLFHWHHGVQLQVVHRTREFCSICPQVSTWSSFSSNPFFDGRVSETDTQKFFLNRDPSIIFYGMLPITIFHVMVTLDADTIQHVITYN